MIDAKTILLKSEAMLEREDVSKGFARFHYLPNKIKQEMYKVEFISGRTGIPEFNVKISSMLEDMTEEEFLNLLTQLGKNKCTYTK